MAQPAVLTSFLLRRRIRAYPLRCAPFRAATVKVKFRIILGNNRFADLSGWDSSAIPQNGQ
jgi:hypothetical protein